MRRPDDGAIIRVTFKFVQADKLAHAVRRIAHLGQEGFAVLRPEDGGNFSRPQELTRIDHSGVPA